MDDHIALLVGRVILAWGELDQHLYLSLRELPRILGQPEVKEGRFFERRKLFRRYCVALAQDDPFAARLDRFLGQTLAGLETSRGQIAHGFAMPWVDDVVFLHVPEIFATKPGEQAEEKRIFTRENLVTLASDIDAAKMEIIRLTLDAIGLARR